MSFFRTLRMSFSALFYNKVRSLLTMLGIIIGVLAVTMLISLGQSTQQFIAERLNDLGSDMLLCTISPQQDFDITPQDIRRLADDTPEIAAISPCMTVEATLSWDGYNGKYKVDGVNEMLMDVRNLELLDGENFSPVDIHMRASVVMIGANVAYDFFGTTDVVGNTLRINGLPFTVIGVYSEKGGAILGSQNDMISIPITTAQRLFKYDQIKSIYAKAETGYNVEAERTLRTFLMEITDDDEMFSILNQQMIIDIITDITRMLTSMLAGIAAISLLVGGIGIMNIMLVSVTERTREIGIRKAIGAQKGSIILQFLLEAVFLSLVGGLIGLALGAVGLKILERMLGMTLFMTPQVALMAMGFSLVIGVLFGIYPANKAANLQPIEALRYQ